MKMFQQLREWWNSPREIIVVGDGYDPIRDEVIHRAFLTGKPVFATVDDDGNVTFATDVADKEK